MASEEVRAALIAGFRTQLSLYPDHLVESVDLERANEYGAAAARTAIAPALWSTIVGERWDTSQAVSNLGVTRQALAKRVANGTLIGIPGRGTTYYPIWQFDLSSNPLRVRPAVAAVLSAWMDEAGVVDQFAMVSWARTPQPELGGTAPLDLLEKDTIDPEEQVVFSARIAAARLAQ